MTKDDLLETLKRVILDNALRLSCPSSYGLTERDPVGTCFGKQGKRGTALVCRNCWKHAFKQATIERAEERGNA